MGTSLLTHVDIGSTTRLPDDAEDKPYDRSAAVSKPRMWAYSASTLSHLHSRTINLHQALRLAQELGTLASECCLVGDSTPSSCSLKQLWCRNLQNSGVILSTQTWHCVASRVIDYIIAELCFLLKMVESFNKSSIGQHLYTVTQEPVSGKRLLYVDTDDADWSTAASNRPPMIPPNRRTLFYESYAEVVTQNSTSRHSATIKSLMC